MNGANGLLKMIVFKYCKTIYLIVCIVHVCVHTCVHMCMCMMYVLSMGASLPRFGNVEARQNNVRSQSLPCPLSPDRSLLLCTAVERLAGSQLLVVLSLYLILLKPALESQMVEFTWDAGHQACDKCFSH